MKLIMFLLMFADKEPEKSTPSTVASTTSTMSNPPSRIVNNGMLINIRENQRGNEKIQSSRTSNIRHIRHIVKTKKATEN